jgi:hypothetical protein
MNRISLLAACAALLLSAASVPVRSAGCPDDGKKPKVMCPDDGKKPKLACPDDGKKPKLAPAPALA